MFGSYQKNKWLGSEFSKAENVHFWEILSRIGCLCFHIVSRFFKLKIAAWSFCSTMSCMGPKCLYQSILQTCLVKKLHIIWGSFTRQFFVLMFQQNFNNFWTYWATELRLDPKEASFKTVFGYVFISYLIHRLVLISEKQSKIRFFLLI